MRQFIFLYLIVIAFLGAIVLFFPWKLAFGDNVYPAQTGDKHTCPICAVQKKIPWKSKVYPNGCSQTLNNCGIGFWDENGDYQVPKRCNTQTCGYSCSKGHLWFEEQIVR